MTQPPPLASPHEPGLPPQREGPQQRSGWWIALLAVLPAACCGLPFLLAAGAAAGTGALTGGITGAVLVAAGAGLAVVVLRRRTRSAAPPPRGPVDKGRDRDGSC